MTVSISQVPWSERQFPHVRRTAQAQWFEYKFYRTKYPYEIILCFI